MAISRFRLPFPIVGPRTYAQIALEHAQHTSIMATLFDSSSSIVSSDVVRKRIGPVVGGLLLSLARETNLLAENPPGNHKVATWRLTGRAA